MSGIFNLWTLMVSKLVFVSKLFSFFSFIVKMEQVFLWLLPRWSLLLYCIFLLFAQLLPTFSTVCNDYLLCNTFPDAL